MTKALQITTEITDQICEKLMSGVPLDSYLRSQRFAKPCKQIIQQMDRQDEASIIC